MQTPLGAIYRFGPFEVHAASSELLKNGTRTKLQEQPFRLLLVLLENAGEVVTRTELRNRIWPENMFVDFDSSVRVAVRKLREALGDDAEKPRYIETVPKRGYRFLLEDVHPETPVHHAANSDCDSSPSAAISPMHGGQGTAASAEKPGRVHTWLFSVVFVIVVIAAATVMSRSHVRQVLTGKDTVVLADFSNSTGDPVFDETLRQGIAVQLGQSPFLSLISDERIQQVLRMMGRSADARLTPEMARELCERIGSAAVLEGSIAKLGNQYVLGLRAKDCRSGSVLDEEQAQAARKEDVLHALDQVASRFRTRIGESLATVEKHSTPLAEATTPSLEALRAYSAGRKVHSSNASAARFLFKRAVDIDPQFATAYVYLGHVHGELGESDLAAEATSQAYRLRNHASDEEELFITASYQFRVTGNMEKLQRTCEAWVQTYPRERNAHLFLAGHVYQVHGTYDLAVEEAKKAIELDPDFAIAYDTLAFSYENLGRLNEAEQTVQQATARNLQLPDFFERRYNIAFLRADKTGMEREVAMSRGKSIAEDLIADQQSLASAYSGRLQQARSESRQAVNMAQQGEHRERAALYEAGAALREAFFGNAAEARQRAMRALDLSRDREVEYGAALALALSGETAQASALAHDLDGRFGEDTSVQFSYLPALRARLALNHGEPSKAIEQLQIALPFDLGQPYSRFHGFFGSMYPVYVRGEAYLAAHKGIEAAAEFQKVLDHRSIVVSDPIGALAHLQLGRAYALAGDSLRSKAAYQDFFTLWENADPNIPILQQARAEYAKQQRPGTPPYLSRMRAAGSH